MKAETSSYAIGHLQNLSKSVVPGFGSWWSNEKWYQPSSGSTVTASETIAGPTSTSSSSHICHSASSFATESANIAGSSECAPRGRIHMSWLPGT